MKLSCGQWLAEREARKSQWHVWFAWHPVRVGQQDCRWLESVWRKGTLRCAWSDCWWDYEYLDREGKDTHE